MAIFALPHSYGEERDQLVWSRFDEPQMAMGECYMDKRDAIAASYIRYAEDVEEGEALCVRAPLLTIAAATGLLDGNTPAGSTEIDFAASTTLATMISNGLFTNDSDLKEMRGYAQLRAEDSTPSPNVVRRGVVINFTATRLYVIWDTDDGRLDVALNQDTTAFSLTCPWLVERAAANKTVVGYAQEDAKAKEYGLIQYAGLGKVKVTAAVAAGAPLYAIGTGSSEGETDDEASPSVETTSATAGNAATLADEVIDAQIHASPISKIPHIPEPFLRGQRRPGEAQHNLSS